jgi:ABC-type nickel/cobalt efflux system permease component RcnA
MIRFVIVAVGLAVFAWAVMRLAREARKSNLDWWSLIVIVLIVAAAIWLRQETGIGGLM